MKVILKQQTFFILRFDVNQEYPNDEFINFLKNNNITGGYFFGLGNAQYIKVAYIDINDKQYHSSEFNGSMEISNITGEISLKDVDLRGYKRGFTRIKDDDINIHTHITFSNEKFEAFAGHLEKLKVGGTLELFLFKTDTLHRKFSPEVGFQILD